MIEPRRPGRAEFTMRIETRFLILFLPAIALVMTVYALLAERSRETVIVPQVRQEAEAYAIAVAAALSRDSAGEPRVMIERLLTELAGSPAHYTIVIYSQRGWDPIAAIPPAASVPPSVAELEAAASRTAPLTFRRHLADGAAMSVLLALRDRGGATQAVLEITRPLEFVEAERAALRRHFILGAATLWLVIGILTIWLLRRSIGAPLRRLTTAAQAVGRGDLGYRLESPSAQGELRTLATEFNRMAEHVEMARAELLHEADERVTLERKLRQTERMIAIGGLSSGLAHQIAPPLNVIAGRAQLLEGAPLSESDRRNLRIITEQVDRISRLVRSLLEFSRRRELRLARVDLIAVANEVLGMLRAECERVHVEVVREFAGPADVSGDAELLHEAVANLVLNAVQAMESVSDARRLTLRVRSADGVPRDAGAGVVCEVIDSGPGIPEELLSRIFEPLFTTKRRGTGLGLVIARSIVEEHGGTLGAQNATHSGAVLRLTLPRYKGKPNRA